jgi:expansin (peptidoglycan-binding protein)
VLRDEHHIRAGVLLSGGLAMLVPLLGLILSVSLFGAIGLLALWALHIRQRRVLALVIFIATAQVGMHAFDALYAAAFANAQNQLDSRTQVVWFLLGLPVSGSLIAWIVLRWAVSTPWWAHSTN